MTFLTVLKTEYAQRRIRSTDLREAVFLLAKNGFLYYTVNMKHFKKE